MAIFPVRTASGACQCRAVRKSISTLVLGSWLIAGSVTSGELVKPVIR